MSELKQDDFIALEDLGLKPFMLMKIKRWSTSGGVTDVLPSSSTVPPPALTSSVPLTVGDRVDNAQHDTENESDGSVSNDTGERESHEDCVLIDATETVDYWKRTIEVKKGAQVERKKRVRIFNPLHVLANKMSVSDVEGLKILKLSQHPQIMLQIEVMKTEVIKYQTLADSIKPHVERKDVKGNDTFEISDWWKANCAMLPAFTYVLRAVLTNSPNSCPPERLFSIFNSTFDADQSRSYADYMQLSMQSQFKFPQRVHLFLLLT